MGGLSGIGKVLSQLGRAVPLVLPEPQGSPEPLTFEVVYQPFVAVRTGPSKTRPIQVGGGDGDESHDGNARKCDEMCGWKGKMNKQT